MITRYRKGADFERRVLKHLEKQGYVVFRAAGSKSPVDLVALRSGEVMLVQCRVDGRLRGDREKLALLGQELGCREVRKLKIGEIPYD
jgi:Holliday junction resolvase